MQGSGAVRDLLEAASLSSSLASTLISYASASTRSEQFDQLDSLVYTWAASSSMNTSVGEAATEGYELIYLVPGLSAADYEPLLYSGFTASGQNTDSIDLSSYSEEEQQKLAELRDEQQAITRLIGTLERFNGTSFVDVAPDAVVTGAGSTLLVSESGERTSSSGAVFAGVQRVYVSLSSAQLGMLNSSFEALKDSVYYGLLTQTRLSSYLNAIGVQWSGEELVLDFSPMEQLLAAELSTDNEKAYDAFDLATVLDNNGASWNLRDFVQANIESLASLNELGDTPFDNERYIAGSLAPDALTGTSADNFMLAGAGDDIVITGAGDDDVFAGKGNDVVTASHSGSNYLHGGSGDDHLQVARTDTKYAYNAQIAAGNSNTLIGGEGSDRLEGWTGSDTYVFNRGDGQDLVSDYDFGYQYAVQQGFGKTDRIQFGDDVMADDLWFRRIADDLVIDTIGSADQVRVENWYAGSVYQVESIESANAVLSSNLVDQLVNAMAAFDVPAGDGAVVPQDTKEQLAPVLSSSWQPMA
jgi:Ca2+-binding RTX toxin-like protein